MDKDVILIENTSEEIDKLTWNLLSQIEESASTARAVAHLLLAKYLLDTDATFRGRR